MLDLQILWCLPEWVLHPQSESSEPKPGDYRPDYPTAEATQNTYDYRRMQLCLNKNGCHRNPKTILRLNALLSEIHGRRQWKQLRKYQNLLNRIFQAEAPNHKWVIDISYIQTKQGILCLSVSRDLYDNSIVAYKTATQQTVKLVLNTIRLAMNKEKVVGELHLHSDQGFQYTSQAYFNLTKKYGIILSISGRGNCYDNAIAENFFDILKAECIYHQKLKTVQQASL